MCSKDMQEQFTMYRNYIIHSLWTVVKLILSFSGIILFCIVLFILGKINKQSHLHRTRDDGIISFTIEPEEIQPGEIITARWELRYSYDWLDLHIPHDGHYSAHKWPIDNPSAGIFTFTLPITLNRYSPVVFWLYNGRSSKNAFVPLICKREWFFEPRSSHCPGEIIRMKAWQQDFDSGTIIRSEEDVSATRTNRYSFSYSLGKNGYIGETQSQSSKEMIGDKENFGNSIGPEREFWTCYTSPGLPNAKSQGHIAYFSDADSRIIRIYRTRWQWHSWEFIEGNFIDCNKEEQEK